MQKKKKKKKKKDIGLRLLLLYFTNLTLPQPASLDSEQKMKDITLTKCKINGYIINAMVDSGSVGTFVSKNIAKELNLFIIPKQKTIALADPTQHAKIIDETIVDISLRCILV